MKFFHNREMEDSCYNEEQAKLGIKQPLPKSGLEP
jgi:hypothetical protein